jgi:hypothetical protein
MHACGQRTTAEQIKRNPGWDARIEWLRNNIDALRIPSETDSSSVGSASAHGTDTRSIRWSKQQKETNAEKTGCGRVLTVSINSYRITGDAMHLLTSRRQTGMANNGPFK